MLAPCSILRAWPVLLILAAAPLLAQGTGKKAAAPADVPQTKDRAYDPQKVKIRRIESRHGPNWCIGVHDGKLVLSRNKTEQSFRIHTGFVGEGTVALEPLMTGGSFLVNDDNGFRLAPFSETPEFQKAASFKKVSPPVDWNNKGFFSLESVAKPGEYIGHENFNIYVRPRPWPHARAAFRFVGL
jgi:hypothetical protein